MSVKESNFSEQFEESLKKLSIEGIILLQGLLAQRALQLLTEKPKPKKNALIKPEIYVPSSN